MQKLLSFEAKSFLKAFYNFTYSMPNLIKLNFLSNAFLFSREFSRKASTPTQAREKHFAKAKDVENFLISFQIKLTIIILPLIDTALERREMGCEKRRERRKVVEKLLVLALSLFSRRESPLTMKKVFLLFPSLFRFYDLEFIGKFFSSIFYVKGMASGGKIVWFELPCRRFFFEHI